MSELPESLPRRDDDEARRAVAYEAALDEALGEVPRAEELVKLHDVLATRQKALAEDFETTEDAVEREALRRRLEELDEQVAILQEEARINRFVEDTIKFSHEVHRLSEG